MLRFSRSNSARAFNRPCTKILNHKEQKSLRAAADFESFVPFCGPTQGENIMTRSKLFAIPLFVVLSGAFRHELWRQLDQSVSGGPK